MATSRAVHTLLESLVLPGIETTVAVDATVAAELDWLPDGQFLTTVERAVNRAVGPPIDAKMVVCCAMCNAYGFSHTNTIVSERDILQAWRVLELVDATQHPFSTSYDAIIHSRQAAGYRYAHSPTPPSPDTTGQEPTYGQLGDCVSRVSSTDTTSTIPAFNTPGLTELYLGRVSAACLLNRDPNDPVVASYCDNMKYVVRNTIPATNWSWDSGGFGACPSV